MSSRFYTKHQALSTQQLMERAPSIFAAQPASNLSTKYAFIPTTKVVTLLQDAGWAPVYAAQSKARGEDGGDFMKHVIRFQNPSNDGSKLLKVGDSIPEIVVSNSHNGTSSFRFFAGLYRLVCSNGMVVSDGAITSARIRHQGYRDEEVKTAIVALKESLPILTETVTAFRDTKLSTEQRLAFASEALLLRWDAGKAPIEAIQLLDARRPQDATQDLWTTLNVVQENLVQGGLHGRAVNSTRRRRMTTREIASVNGNLRLNRELWALAEQTLQAA